MPIYPQQLHSNPIRDYNYTLMPIGCVAEMSLNAWPSGLMRAFERRVYICCIQVIVYHWHCFLFHSQFHGSPYTNSHCFVSLVTSSGCAINRQTCVFLTHRFLRRIRLQFFWRNFCDRFCPWTDTRQKYFTRIQPHVWSGKKLEGHIITEKYS